MELLTAAFPKVLHEDLYSEIAQLQDKLGQIHDNDVTMARLINWRAGTNSRKEAAFLKKQLTQERRRQTESLRTLNTWWTPKFQTRLQYALMRLTK